MPQRVKMANYLSIAISAKEFTQLKKFDSDCERGQLYKANADTSQVVTGGFYRRLTKTWLRVGGGIVRRFRHLAVVVVTIITSLAIVSSPAYAGTLTTMSLAVSNLQTSTTSKYDWGFKTATTGTLTRVAATVPAGTSAAGKYLALAANNSNTNNAEAPDSVANSVTGALDLRAQVAATDWTPSWAQVIMMKWNGSPNYTFNFELETSGLLTLGRSGDGSATTFASSSTATGFTDGTSHWVRVTYLPNDGAGNRVTTFYTSLDGIAWTSLGTAVSQSGASNNYDSNSPVDVGGNGGQAFAGKIYYAEERNGIAGPVVLSMDPGDITASSPSTWTSKRTQETWTLTRTGADLKADIGADLVINAATGIPSTGTAVLRMTDSIVLYSFTATSVSLNTTSTLKVFGVINTATAGAFTSTITTYDNSATPASVDTGSPAAVTFTKGNYATPNFVQKVTNTSTTGATITGVLSSNTAVGDVLVAAITWNSSMGTTWTCSDNQNNVYTNGPSATVVASTQTTAICYAPVTTAGSTTLTVTFAGSTNKKGVVFSEYSGVANVNPVDVTATNTGSSTTSANAVTSTATTTTTPNDLIFGAVGNATAGANTATAGTSFTLRGDVTVTAAHDFVNEDRVLATAGSQAATFTYTAAGQAYGAVMIAFKPALVATPAYVQKSQNGSATNNASISATFGSSTVVGNIIVVGATWDSSGATSFTCSDDSGSNSYTTLAVGNFASNQATGICYAIVKTAGSSTVTATPTTSRPYKAIAIQEYSGVNLDSPVDVSSGAFSTTGTTAANNISSGSATSTWSNELIFGSFENSSASVGSTTAGTTSAAFALRGGALTSGGAGNEFTTEEGITGAAGSVAATETYGTAPTSYEAAMATFRPAILGNAATAAYGQSGDFTTKTAAATATGMSAPAGSATDPIRHRLFVPDSGNNRVLVFNCDTRNVPSDATADFVIGQSTLTTANSAAVTQTGLNGPNGVVYDGANNRLYVADQNANRVMVYDAGNIANGMNASYVLGQSGYTANATTTDNATLSGPQDLYFDGANSRLYVGDTGHNRVMVFSTSGISSGMTATYVLGQSGFGANGAAVTSTGLSAPVGVSLDQASGYLWVGDKTNNRVVGYNTASLATGMAATYVLGQSTLTAGGSGVSQSTMNAPAQVVAGSGVLFVSDVNNNRVLRFNTSLVSNGMNASGVYGQGNYVSKSATTSQNTMSAPRGIRYDNTQGQLWVGDAGNNRVLQFGIDNSPFAPSSLVQYQSDGSTVISVGGSSSSSTAIFKATTADADTSDTEKLCVEIQPTSIAFTGYDTACGSAVAQGSIASVTIATLSSGINYHWQVRSLDGAGTYSNWTPYGNNSDTVTAVTDIYFSTGIGADYVYGQGGSYTTSGSNTTSTTLNHPAGTAIDGVHHRLFQADQTNNRVLVFNLDSSNNPTDDTADYVLGQTDFVSSSNNTTQNKLSAPFGLAYDSVNDRLFVGDIYNNRVLVFSTSTITNGMNAAYVLGQADFVSSSSATTQSGLNGPRHLEYDSTNNRLFVSDISNGRVLVFNTSTITNGMNAAYVLGKSDFVTSGNWSGQVGLAQPQGLSYDPSSQYLYVADSGNGRTMVFNLSTITNGMNALYVLGKSDFSAYGYDATQSGQYKPVEVDATSANIYVLDETDNRVTAYTKAALANGMNASTVYGQPTYTSSGAATTRYGMSGPDGMRFDSTSGKLYVADTANNRILVYNVDNAPSTPTSLTQYKSDGTTSLSTNAWYNATTMVFKGVTSDSDVLDTNSLCVEIKPVSTAFTNVATACGTAVTQGTTATVTISSLTTNTQYHWQARTVDSSGISSAWASYGGNSDTITAASDVGIDTTVPATGSIYDGASAGVDAAYNDGTLTTLSGNWSGFTETSGSGIATYTYSIGTTIGGTDVYAGATTASTSFSVSTLSLRTSQIYYVNVYATDVAGNTSAAVSSNGQLVAPTLTFSVSGSSIQFAHLNSGNSYTNSQSLNVTTSTNGYGGYVVKQWAGGALTYGSKTVSGYAGTYATPTAWSGTGFGYTSNDTSIQGSGDLFGGATKYSALSTTAPGDIVADHTATVQGTPIANETFTFTYKVAVPSNQASGVYTTMVHLAAIVTF